MTPTQMISTVRPTITPAALVAAVVALASCGRHASFGDCQIECSAASGCPDDFVCGTEGYCRPSGAGTVSCSDIIEDAHGYVRTIVLAFRAPPNRNLDLLFLIDDSVSMADKQASVAAAFPAFVRELSSLDGGLPNLHIGIASSDMGTKGSAVANPGPAIGTAGNGGCSGYGKAGELQTRGAAVTDLYISDIDQGGTRVRNYTGTLEDVFRQMVSLGAIGCGFEQHLHAIRTALGNPSNAGFLRPDAGLGVIVLSDEDDCSILDPAVLGPESPQLGILQSFRCFQFGVECVPDDPTGLNMKSGCKPRASSTLIEDVAPSRTFLAAIKPDPRDVMFGVLAGDPERVAVELRAAAPALAHSCNYTVPAGMATADPAVRLQALVKSFPGRARFESVCNADLAPALTRLAQTAKQLVGGSCLERPIATPADCVVDDVVGADTTRIRPCDSGATPCWELVEDATRCSDQPQHLELIVTRTEPAPPDTWTTVRCTTP